MTPEGKAMEVDCSIAVSIRKSTRSWVSSEAVCGAKTHAFPPEAEIRL